MKRFVSILLCALSLAAVAPAQAHGYGGWHGGGGYYHDYHREYRGGYGGGWVGPLLGAALVGGAIYAATTPRYEVVTPGYVVPSAPPRVAYFCPTSQQFYPNVPACNVPWQLTNY
jgi:hypothetical protein